VKIDDVAETFSMSKSQLADITGPKAHSQVREMRAVINLVQGWAGGTAQAIAWYRAEPIPAFGGRTAEALVKSGNATAVRDYVDHLATGGYA